MHSCLINSVRHHSSLAWKLSLLVLALIISIIPASAGMAGFSYLNVTTSLTISWSAIQNTTGYGMCPAWATQNPNSGDIYVTGNDQNNYNTAPNQPTFLEKYDAQGNRLWIIYPSANNLTTWSWTNAISHDHKAVYIAGKNASGVGMMTKYDINGNFIWVSQTNINNYLAVIKVASNGIIYGSASSGNTVAIDPNTGVQLWKNVNSVLLQSFDMVFTSTGYIVVIGTDWTRYY